MGPRPAQPPTSRLRSPDPSKKWDFGPSKVPDGRPFLSAMEANRTSEITGDSDVLDCATLYLCRQGRTWVVVIESPAITGALLLRHSGRDPYDARFELLARARLACPQATIETTDGAADGADYEWRIEVHGVEQCAGDLGVRLHHELSGKRQRQRHQRRLFLRQASRHCRASRFPSFPGRPFSF